MALIHEKLKDWVKSEEKRKWQLGNKRELEAQVDFKRINTLNVPNSLFGFTPQQSELNTVISRLQGNI